MDGWMMNGWMDDDDEFFSRKLSNGESKVTQSSNLEVKIEKRGFTRKREQKNNRQYRFIEKIIFTT